MSKFLNIFIILLCIGLFIYNPNLLLSYFTSVFALIILIPVLILTGIYIYSKASHKSLEEVGLKDTTKKALVGHQGIGIPLSIKETNNNIHVQWATKNYVIMLITLVILGSGFIFLQLSGQIPSNYSTILLSLIPFVAVFAIIRNFIFFRKSLVINSLAIKYLVGLKEDKLFWKHQIDKIASTSYTYRTIDDGIEYSNENYILVATMSAGETIYLCMTDNKSQIDNLIILMSKYGYNVEI